MITKLTHVTLMVQDQEEAANWFMENLGLIKVSDSPMGENARWVTLGIQNQPGLEIILQHYTWGPGDATEAGRAARIGKEQGFIFQVDDCHKMTAEMKTKGVKFVMEPSDFPWGIQAMFLDLYGNCHSLSQPPSQA
ncbi:MAG: lyase [Chloroflexota bacterium]|nr:glyoxalase [Chloroflexota bacterium]NOG63296.1 glyoxalase [Chloroflexota bacterium]GIK64556.1 MAG: lyase [Chloroflexota bacterium]